MSHTDYLEFRELRAKDPSFYALIMTAMSKADNTNKGILQRAYPNVWKELQARYMAPGGKLASDFDSNQDNTSPLNKP